ncbi:MAG: VOC family protein [Pseudomonadota bacterium]
MTTTDKTVRAAVPGAVHSVHEFVFSVPDLEQAAHFYTSFGLDVRRENGEIGLYTAGHPQRWARVLQGEHKKLLWVTLGIDEADVSVFEQRFARHGVARIAAPAGAPDGFWICAPDGLPLRLLPSIKCSPSAKTVRVFAPEHSESGRAPRRSQAQPVRPTHLSHILLFTPDVAANIRFYTDMLGLRLSDQSGEIVAFLHSAHGSDHHLIAFAKSDHVGLHHSSWDVPSFDAVGAGSQQMAQAGYRDGWGIGRHVLGSNYFRYVRDPWGAYAEYSFDIDFIPPGAIWPAADYLPEDALYVWGPDLPEDFIQNYEPA